MSINKSLAVLCVVLVSLTSCDEPKDASVSANGSSSAASNASSATAVVDKLNSGDFSGVVAMFDATMAAALPVAALQQTWTGLTQQAGAFLSRGTERTANEMGMEAVYVPCTFERATLTAKVVFNGEGRIAGLFFQ